MWSAAALPVALGAIPFPAAAGPRYHLVAVGRREGGEAEAPSSAQKQVAKQKQRQLSGSDVLMALQRAAEKKKKKKKKNKKNIDDAGGGGVRARESSSHSSAALIVKSICINPQWAHQLHQLETRLHQLPHA